MRGFGKAAAFALMAMMAGAMMAGAIAPSARAAPVPNTDVQRGEYLYRAADCAACHENGATHDLSGGRAFVLPFGTLHATNITPDREHGIGAYDDAAWLRMMHRGIARDGRHLYPAMPYTSYALMSDADALAIRAYLFSLPPVHANIPQNAMRFPFNQRWAMAAWNLIYNPSHPMRADPVRTKAWNRGAYLTEALGHCAQCHTPRTILYGLSGRAYAGAVQEGWRAYNLTADPAHGIGAWTDADLARYLATGAALGHGPASGPMADAVSHSLRYLTPEDIAAMVVYLRTVPARPDGPPVSASPVAGHPEMVAHGAMVFADACVGCHLTNGAGRQSAWADLRGAHDLADPAATNLRAVIMQGSAIQTPYGQAAMPGFARGYDAAEIDALIAWLQAGHGGAVAR